MNLAYQLARHLAVHMRQWPNSDRGEVERTIRRALLTGNAWVFVEPQQLEIGL